MKSRLAILLLALAATTAARADHVVTVANTRNYVGDIAATDVSLAQDGQTLLVSFAIDLTELHLKSNQATLLTPYIVGENDSVQLPPVGIYGRKQYYYYKRNNGDALLGGSEETVVRAKDMPDALDYATSVRWADYMDHCRLTLVREDFGCCNEPTGEDTALLATMDKEVYVPTYIYVHPRAEGTKTRALSGSALIGFTVNNTEIKPEYKNNAAELDKIRHTLEQVVGDADVQISLLTLKGYASPEGSYKSNARLAEGRTQSLRNYIVSRYGIRPELMSVSSEPENWEGFRQAVEASSLPHRTEILRIIDADGDPDTREKSIRARYPADYKVILTDIYPPLRKTDYRVEYTVRQFTDVDEIRRLVRTAPGKLSLEEFYLAAQGLEPGTDEFNEIYDVAVRMYPDDDAANLNAANAAMARGDLITAERHLARAGQSPEATYARGVYAALSGDMDTARQLFEQSKLNQ